MSREVSKAEVRHMAQLSRLTVTAREEELFCRQFGKILGHMDILNSMDTTGVAPLYSPVHQHGQTRLDTAENIRDRCEILSNAPETDGACFIVPRIV